MLRLFLRFALVSALLPSCVSLRRSSSGLDGFDVGGQGDVDFGALDAKQAECDALLKENEDNFQALADAQKAQQLLRDLDAEHDSISQSDDFHKSIYPVGSRCEVNYDGTWYPGTVKEFANGIFKVQADSDPEGTWTSATFAGLIPEKGGDINKAAVLELMSRRDKINMAKDTFTEALNMQKSATFSKSASGSDVTSNLKKFKKLIPDYSGEGYLRYDSLTEKKNTRYGAKAFQYRFTAYNDKWDSKIWDHGNGPKQDGAEFDFGGWYANKETVSMTRIPEFQLGGKTYYNLRIRMTKRGVWSDSNFILEWDLVQDATACPLMMDIESQTVTCEL